MRFHSYGHHPVSQLDWERQPHLLPPGVYIHVPVFGFEEVHVGHMRHAA